MTDSVVHPGKILLAELKSRCRKQTFFAKLIGKKKQEVNYIVVGKKPINTERALRISAALGTDPLYRLDLQSRYNVQNFNEKKLKDLNTEVKENMKNLLHK